MCHGQVIFYENQSLGIHIMREIFSHCMDHCREKNYFLVFFFIIRLFESQISTHSGSLWIGSEVAISLNETEILV